MSVAVTNGIIRPVRYWNHLGSSFPPLDYLSASETFPVKFPGSISSECLPWRPPGRVTRGGDLNCKRIFLIIFWILLHNKFCLNIKKYQNANYLHHWHCRKMTFEQPPQWQVDPSRHVLPESACYSEWSVCWHFPSPTELVRSAELGLALDPQCQSCILSRSLGD